MLALAIAIIVASRSSTPLESWVEAEMKLRHLPGVAVGVYRYGKPVEIVTRGFADIRGKVPVARNTVFEICSVTKQFTAVAALLLVEDGKIRLDDPISKYVDGIPESWSGITVRRLLNHTSGVPDKVFKREQSVTNPAKAIENLVKLPVAFSPGEAWSYNNTGYWLIGRAIEKCSGMPYFTFLEKRIFEPLGMRHTFPNRRSLSIPNQARGYLWNGKRFQTAGPLTDSIGYSAGGLVSTVDDMHIWSDALMTGKILRPASRREMLKPARLRSGREALTYARCGYGMGVFLDEKNGHRIEKHSGGWNDASCQLARFPDDGLTVVMLTNVGNYEERTFVGERIAHLFVSSIEPPNSRKAKVKGIRSTGTLQTRKRLGMGFTTSPAAW